MKSLVKILSLKICLLAVLVFVCAPTGTDPLSVFSPAASAASDPIMMYGKTTPVLTNGINNAGNIWFQNDGVTVYLANDVSQQPKLVPDPSSPGGYKIEGWAWSDNLGWVSFSCKGGKNPPTTGATCGNFDYGVTIDATGTFHGYAWNDAMGYINMNSETYNPPALDGLGKPIVHAVKMTTTGAISGYAWSQSLGWLNFNGAYGRIKIEVPPTVNRPEQCPSANAVGLCGCFGSNDPLGGDPSKLNPALDAGVPGAVKVADGYDKYVLSLYFKDENGVEITANKFGSLYDAKILLNWKDKVRRNQTNVNFAVASYDKFSKPFQDSTGAIIYKPVLLYTTDINTLDPVSGDEALALGSKEILSKTTFDISSVAPTSKANTSKILNKSGVATGTVSNDDLSLVPGFSDADVEAFKDSNYLILESIDWAIKNKNTGVTINGTSSFDPPHGTLEFKPALEVSKMTNSLSANTLWMFRNVPVGVEVMTDDNRTNPNDGTIKLNHTTTLVDFFVGENPHGGFDTGFTANTVDWIDEINNAQNLPEVATDKNIKTLFTTFTTQQDDLKLKTSIPSLENLPGNYSEGAGIYSKVGYVASVQNAIPQIVSYFSNHLPRVDSTAISNPVVVIQGTTYSQGNEVSSPQSGVNITGIGDQNINIVRDLVFENIQKLLMDKTVPTHFDGKVDLPNLAPGSCTNEIRCLLIELDRERIFYFSADNVVIKDVGDIHVPDLNPKNTVVVVSGGDLHVESNLYTSVASKKVYKIGLVALREKALDEGNIYIAPNVTNIQALMIADGTLFSAPNFGFTTNNFGEPDDPVKQVTPSEFNRQLLIEGGISSRNCIGCVDSNASSFFLPTRGPLLKDGETNGVPNKDIAKKYDLNYLRYFSLQLEYDLVTGEPIDQQCATGCNGIDPINPVSKNGDLVVDEDLKAEGLKDKDDKINAVYIKYVPPSTDSFVFSKEKSLTF